MLLADAVFVDDGNGLLHSFESGQVVVDLCQLNPEATQLHLWVQAMTTGESCAGRPPSIMLAFTTDTAYCGKIPNKHDLIELSRHHH